ncbi:hypothetical protein C1I60_14115 [Paenibacillus terrae]|uniref:Uncharacterized protein n=1 Tax=Paenibacillus terrae TaxID=159743 RepID=A0A4U2Q273_9BACL|nr:hypothetical protein [Paenibacillus terrae]TKH43428.1 hypothetical protein C1I60_14115 [Paenibacillus terrae]
MIKTVTFRNYRFFTDADDCIVLRRVDKEPSIKVSLPFHEDTPNLDLTLAEALSLRNAIDELVDLKLLEIRTVVEQPSTPLPTSLISMSDQSALSSLLDKYRSDSDIDRTARKVVFQAMDILGLNAGGTQF